MVNTWRRDESLRDWLEEFKGVVRNGAELHHQLEEVFGKA